MSEDTASSVKIVVVLCSVFAFLILCSFAPRIPRGVDVALNWESTDGVVVDCQSMLERRFTGRVWTVVHVKEVQYQYEVDGIIYDGTMSYSDSLSTGTSLTVKYNPDNPGESRGYYK